MWVSGSKGSPKLAFSRLAASSAGLICLSGCSHGEIPSLLLRGKRDEARQEAEKYLSVFGAGNFYVEVQHHLHPDDGRLCRQLVDLSKALGVRVAASK
jgi:DNA polymerase-3 subunit alpha